jgi:hypothetical protein|nr:MAG TPA: hypothetical protein [Caudoviricetes sp.]
MNDKIHKYLYIGLCCIILSLIFIILGIVL